MQYFFSTVIMVFSSASKCMKCGILFNYVKTKYIFLWNLYEKYLCHWHIQLWIYFRKHWRLQMLHSNKSNTVLYVLICIIYCVRKFKKCLVHWAIPKYTFIEKITDTSFIPKWNHLYSTFQRLNILLLRLARLSVWKLLDTFHNRLSTTNQNYLS